MKLSLESIEFARNHLEYNADSDFYPKADYFREIWKVWDKVKNYLHTTHISDFEVYPPRKFEAPKHHGNFRNVHQLEPFNAIIFDALIYTIAANQTVIKRLKLNPSAQKNMFGIQNLCPGTSSELKSLIENNTYVLKTDIKDFTNQIYIPKLQKIIENLDPSLKEISRELSSFLLKLNSNSPKGLPTGPDATMILVEILMTDVDDFIKNKNLEFSRFVDDFRIFSNSKEDLESFLSVFSIYLEKEHKLNLSEPKTLICKTSDELKEEKIFLKQKKKAERKTIDEVIKNSSSYRSKKKVLLDDLTIADRITVLNQTTINRFMTMVESGNYDFIVSKHAINQCCRKKDDVILPVILADFDFFFSSITDICLYMDALFSEKSIQNHLEEFYKILEGSKAEKNTFGRYWLDWLVSKNIGELNKTMINQFLDNQSVYWKIKMAVMEEDKGFIRRIVNEYESLNYWEKYEVLQSLKLLHQDEKLQFEDKYRKKMNNTETFLLEAVIKGEVYNEVI